MSSGYKTVTILWGPGFSKRLRLNTPIPGQAENQYHARTSGELMGGPEQDVLIATPSYSLPYDVEHDSLQPRSFSIRVMPNEEKARYDATWHRRRRDMMKALYSGPIMVIIEREGTGVTGYQALRCKVQNSPETDPGVFDLQLIAANPIFTEISAETTEGLDSESEDRGPTLPNPTWAEDPFAPMDDAWMFRREQSVTFTGNPSVDNPTAEYNPTYTPYSGSAPSDPTIVVRVDGGGRVWRFYKEFQITNPSSVAWENKPICLDLGDVSALVTAGYMSADYGDVRLETPAGVRKPIYVRPYPNRTTGPSLKVWFVLYSLQPGETKTLRVLYGNPNATLEAETFQTKPMFHMYNSDNAHWEYYDFCPKYDQPQSRIAQWTPHTPGRRNLMWLWYSHSDFSPPSDPTLVAQAGGKVETHGRGAGYAGLEFNSPTSIWNVAFTYRTRTNFKAPFVLRIKKKDGSWVDQYVDNTGTGSRTFMYDRGNAGDSHLDVQEKYLTDMGWTVGDTVWVVLQDGTPFSTTITNIDAPNGSFGRIWLAAPIPVGQWVPINWEVVQNPTGRGHTTVSQTFTAGDEPRGLAFGIRVDYPSLDLMGGWYAAAESVTVNFLTAEQPVIRWRITGPTGNFSGVTFASGYAFDLDDPNVTNGYQLRGRIINDYDGKGLRVNFVLKHWNDCLTIDCERHDAWYQEYNWATRSYTAPVNIYSALQFEEVRDYWIRIHPDQDVQAVHFVHDADSNFRNLTVAVYWANKYF